MKKKLLSLFLAVLMVVSIMPTSVFAYLGHIDDAKERDEIPNATYAWDAYGNDAYLQNSYLDLELQALNNAENRTQKDDYYVEMRLRPTYQYENGKDDPNAFMKDSFEINRYGFYNYKLNVDKIELSKVGDVNDPNSKYGIQAVYTLSDTQWNAQKRKNLGNLRDVKETMKAVVTYYFIRLGNGGHNSTVDLPINGDSTIPTKETSAVKIECKIYYKGYDFSDFFINPKIDEEHLFDENNLRKTTFKNKDKTYKTLFTDSPGGIQIKWISGISDFATWGHTENEKAAATLKADRATNYYIAWNEGQVIQTTQDISLGMKEEDSVVEVYTNCYGAFNPFIYLNDMCNYFMSEYDDLYLYSKTSFDAEKNLLKVTSESEFLDSSSPDSDGNGHAVSTMHRIIGYRDMFENSHESTQISTNPDEVTVRNEAGQVGIFRDSQNGFTAQSVSNGTALANLKKQYGEPVALIRGDYEAKNGNYTFNYNSNKLTDPNDKLMAAALSESVIATWKSGGKLVVKSDGTIVGNNISLSTPKFKIYQPKYNSDTLEIKPEKISDDPENFGLSININPTRNTAVHTTNIPHTAVSISNLAILRGGSIILNGNLTVGGLFGEGMDFLGAQIGYGFKNNQFVMNGVKGEGSLKAPRIGSLKLLNLKGKINTFEGQEVYDFSASINIFEKVQANAEITLKRNKITGELLPNKLYADLGIQTPGFVGFPLVAPLPVANITGGGIGFDGLADTVNGNWNLLPPFTLKGTVYGNVIGLVGGKLILEIGASKIALNAEQIKLLGDQNGKFSDIFKSLGMKLELTGEYRDFTPVGQNKMRFSGLCFTGTMNAELGIPKNNQVIGVSAQVGLHGFGGLNENSDWLYMDIGGNAKAYATLQTPQNWKLIGGYKIAEVGTEVALGMETAMPIKNGLNAAFSEAFNNARIYGGIMAQTTFIGVGLRVWYIIPSEFDYDATVSGFEAWNWEDHNVHVTKLYNNQNVQIGLMGVEEGIQALECQPLLKGITETTSSVIIPEGLGDEAILISFIIDENANKASFQNGLSLKDASNTPITPVWLTYDSTGEVITNNETATALWKDVYDSQGNKKQMAIINIGSHSAGSSITIENNSGIEYTTEFSSTTPLTEFDAAMSQLTDAITITPTVTNPGSGKEYVIRTWLGNEKGASDYVLGVNDYNSSFDYDLTGSVAPTDEYYVTAVLMEKVNGEFDETHEGDETAYVPVQRIEFENKVAYTNDVQLPAPTEVTLKAIGNEAMNASWSGVENADAYLVTIYNEDGTKTDCDYLFNVEDFATTAGLSVSEGTYSLDMALTAGGAIEPNKEYIVGVSAIKYLSTEEDGTKSEPVIGAEKLSDAVNLPKHEDLEAEIVANDVILVKNSETAIYEASVNRGYPEDYIGARLPEGVDVQITVTRMDNNEILDSYFDTEYFAIPEFEGSIMLELVASVTEDGVTEKSTYNILVTRDDVAPVLTLDSNIVYSEGEDAHFVVSGTAEEGATVTLTDNRPGYSFEITAVADSEGRFEIEGNGIYSDTIFAVYATDEADNESEYLTVLVNSHNEYEVSVYDSFAESNGEGFYYEGDTVTLNAGTREGYIFIGWTSTDVEIENETKPTASFTMPSDDVAVTAIWAESKTVIFDSNGFGASPASIIVVLGGTVNKPTDPIDSCYTFEGWYKDSACQTPWDFENDVVNDNVRLYAKWTFNSHTDADNDGRCDSCNADVQTQSSWIDKIPRFLKPIFRFIAFLFVLAWNIIKTVCR